MIIENSLIISGKVYKIPKLIISPSGIKHYIFTIDHNSIQNESGFFRKSWCRITVVLTGKKNFKIINDIKKGSNIKIKGFINYHKNHNTINKIVLHANKIKLIDYGE